MYPNCYLPIPNLCNVGMEPDRRGHTLCKSNHGQGMNCMNGPGCNLAAGNYRCPLARGDAVSAAAGSRRVKECGGVERASEGIAPLPQLLRAADWA